VQLAVVGGTGVVGRHVVDAATRSGHDVVVLARSRGIDAVTGAGLDEALRGVDALIDVSNVGTASRRKAEAFFGAATQHLVEAAARAGVGHYVALSIIGIDRVDLGYYAGKRRQEQLLAAGQVPWTVLRCAQFHEFVDQSLARSPGPVAVLPRMRTQPVAAAEVGASLVALAAGPARGQAPELAGPEAQELGDLARQLLRARGSRRKVLTFRLPGQAGKAMAGGGLLPTAEGVRGTTTFAQWLDAARA
jgi:uncharacterized protein YbjT (DUF2867 family)